MISRPNGRFTFWAVWAVFAFAFLVCRWTLFDTVFYNVDEAEYAVAAQALKQNLLPGLDLLGSTKPPGIVLLYPGLFASAGQSILAIQVAGFVLWLLLLALVMKLAERLIPEIPLWMTALGFFLISNSFGHPREIHALNVELPGTVCAVWALLHLTGRHTSLNFVLAGIALGISLLFRQSFVFFAIPAFVLLSPNSVRKLSRVAIGMAIPWIAILTAYANRGGLAWAFESWVKFPMLYAGDTGLAGFFEAAVAVNTEIFGQAFVPVILATFGLFLAIKFRAKVLLALIIASIAAVASGSRFFEHYYIQAFPVAALLAALAMARFQNSGIVLARLCKTFLALGALMALLHFPFWRYWDQSAPPKGFSAESLDGHGLEIELADFASQQSAPDQSIFVWGYCPQIYFHANRLPGVRDYLCEYISGYSPYSTSPRPYARPDAEQMMVNDLKQNSPAIIFDLSFIENYPYSFANYPLANYPLLANHIKSYYHPAATVGSVPIYVLNAAE